MSQATSGLYQWRPFISNNWNAYRFAPSKSKVCPDAYPTKLDGSSFPPMAPLLGEVRREREKATFVFFSAFRRMISAPEISFLPCGILSLTSVFWCGASLFARFGLECVSGDQVLE